MSAVNPDFIPFNAAVFLIRFIGELLPLIDRSDFFASGIGSGSYVDIGSLDLKHLRISLNQTIDETDGAVAGDAVRFQSVIFLKIFDCAFRGVIKCSRIGTAFQVIEADEILLKLLDFIARRRHLQAGSGSSEQILIKQGRRRCE